MGNMNFLHHFSNKYIYQYKPKFDLGLISVNTCTIIKSLTVIRLLVHQRLLPFTFPVYKSYLMSYLKFYLFINPDFIEGTAYHSGAPLSFL